MNGKPGRAREEYFYLRRRGVVPKILTDRAPEADDDIIVGGGTLLHALCLNLYSQRRLSFLG